MQESQNAHTKINLNTQFSRHVFIFTSTKKKFEANRTIEQNKIEQFFRTKSIHSNLTGYIKKKKRNDYKTVKARSK